jgi:hypothetical protein
MAMALESFNSVQDVIADLSNRPEDDKLLVLSALARDLLPGRGAITISDSSGQALAQLVPVGSRENDDELIAELERRRQSPGRVWGPGEIIAHLQSLTR